MMRVIRAIVTLCVVCVVALAGCSTREEIMREREGDAVAGSLEAAAYMAEVEMVRRLIAGGADVNVRFKDGGTPLFSAIRRIPAERNHSRLIERRREVIRVLLEAGADPKVERGGKSLLEAAREGGDEEIDRMLEQAAAKRGGRDASPAGGAT